MPHAIQQIHDSVVTVLTGLTTTGTSVHSGRLHPLERSDMPSLLINTLSETSEYVSFGGARVQRRVMLLDIDAVASVNDLLESTLNTIQLEVENAMSADTKLGGTVLDVQYAGREKFLSGDGEKQIGVCRMSYSIPYEVEENAPDTLLIT